MVPAVQPASQAPRSRVAEASGAVLDGGAITRAGNRTMREKSNLLNGFNLIWVVQPSSRIYSASPSPQISGFFRTVSSRQEGRFAIVTNARRDAVDATASARRMVAG